MNLKTYIEKIGDEQAAALFGVSERTAASWRRGERTPRSAQAQKIVARSNGEVSYEGIYGSEKKGPDSSDRSPSTRKDPAHESAA